MKGIKVQWKNQFGTKIFQFFLLIILLFSHYIEKRDMVLFVLETMAVI
jgi:hypothetical protein